MVIKLPQFDPFLLDKNRSRLAVSGTAHYSGYVTGSATNLTLRQPRAARHTLRVVALCAGRQLLCGSVIGLCR